jgi:uncharacterized membrane protein
MGSDLWTKEILGTDVYHLVMAFIIYSVLGWFVESVYMSICNRKLTNRGFGKGPFCPIYGVGALSGYFLLSPLSEHKFLLYLAGAISATIFEFLVGKLMLKLFGEVWWDYNNKPLNYKGIVCLESTIAWGFYAMIIILFLHDRVIGLINRYDAVIGIRVCKVVLALVLLDYVWKLVHIFNFSFKNLRHIKYFGRIRQLKENERMKKITARIRSFF